MVIGSPERDAVYAPADPSERRLGMAVNPTARSLKAWHEESDALVITAKNGLHLVVVANGGAGK